MDLTKYYSDIEKAVRYANGDPSLEMEVVLKNKKIGVAVFSKVLSKIKSLKGHLVSIEPVIEESLDISFADRSINTRITLLGKKAIMEYCKNNDLTKIPSRFIRIINKERVKTIDVNDYGIRFNSKREKGVSQKTAEATSLISTLKGLDKIFRYKKRYSFTTSDGLFQFDCTVVKTNTSRENRGPNTRKMKSELKDFMKKYVIVPEYVVDRNKYIDELKPTDFVEMIGKSYTEYIPKKNVKAARVFENPMNYEVELEYIGNKLEADKRPDNVRVINGFVENTGLILQIVSDNYFLISEEERSGFFKTYRGLLKDFKFSGPQTVDLELSAVLERDYADYFNTINIRKNYSVTEKADGERNLLVIGEEGKAFMMNRKNVVKATGSTFIGLKNCVIDGEYITKDKHGKPICLYMVFDIYFMNGEDIRDRILIRAMEDRGTTSTIKKSRFEYLDELFANLNIKYASETGIKFTFERKTFYYGSADPFEKRIEDEINRLRRLQNTDYYSKEEVDDITKNIKDLKNDDGIFAHCKTILDKDYVYEIDGLVFTPINLAVGEEPNIRKRNQYSGRWHRSFKWKPQDLITIDFLVEVKKDSDGKPLISYGKHNGEMVPYQSLLLKVGYDPKQHTRYNSFRVLNEAQVYSERYSPIPFQPVNPFMRDTHILYIPLDGTAIKCENGMPIRDGDIVECLYNSKAQGHFNKWKPLRVRDILTPNDFMTANNVWRTFHNPILENMIKTGVVGETREETYYFNVNARKDLTSKSLADYHSFLKKNLIKSSSKSGASLLDLSCGKLGDLNHWIDADLGMCVGLDLNRDNLENVDNGAANRVLNRITDSQGSTPQVLDNILLVWADTSKNVNDSSAGKDELNQYYLDIIKGRAPLEEVKNSKLRKFYGISDLTNGGGFDVVSCQFSIHYFFENEVSLRTFLVNVSENLVKGGKFIGTCLNGSRVFETLAGKTSVERFNDKDKLIWKITKAYDSETFPNTMEGLGMPVDVYFESIGNTTREFLVNMDLLTNVAADYGLKVLAINDFGNKYSELLKLKTQYGDSSKMTDILKEYSFMHDYFIFEKDLKVEDDN